MNFLKDNLIVLLLFRSGRPKRPIDLRGNRGQVIGYLSRNSSLPPITFTLNFIESRFEYIFSEYIFRVTSSVSSFLKVLKHFSIKDERKQRKVANKVDTAQVGLLFARNR